MWHENGLITSKLIFQYVCLSDKTIAISKYFFFSLDSFGVNLIQRLCFELISGKPDGLGIEVKFQHEACKNR